MSAQQGQSPPAGAAAIATREPTTVRNITFPGSLGNDIAASLELPVGTPRAFAVFAHCFTCSSQYHATRRISAALAERGYAVLRFDFTGLGSSEGDFADTTFTSNIEDLHAAGAWLTQHWQEPILLIGHSLGGAAVIAAADGMPSVRAVATISAPACPDHVRQIFTELPNTGGDRLRVDIGGRPFVIGRPFLDDIALQPQLRRLRELDRPLLVLHSPTDAVVSIDNARTILEAAQHPTSFIALDGADHLLSDRRDSDFAADMIAAWAHRYLPDASAAPTTGQGTTDDSRAPGTVTVIEDPAIGYLHTAVTSTHRWLLDEPVSVGGADLGPNPYDMLLAALGGCTSMTMRMYARRKGWEYGATVVRLQHSRIHAADCAECETGSGMISHIHREIVLDPALPPEQRSRLLEIADRCPVHRTLRSEIHITTVEG